MHENVLPITSPADLSQTGHLLFMGQTQAMSEILLDLWEHRGEVEIGVFDFTPEQHLAQTSANLDDDTVCIQYHVTDISEARNVLEELQLAFDFRKKTPSAPGVWVLLIDGLAEEHWELFKDYLTDGKQARMYVIAATRDTLPLGPLYHAFDIIFTNYGIE